MANDAIDFYIGRGENAVWIGTVLSMTRDDLEDYWFWELPPADAENGLPYNENAFRAAVRDALAVNESKSYGPDHPNSRRRNWPHPTAKSDRTAMVLTYSHRAVYVFHEGHLHTVYYPNSSTKVEDFPRMK